MFASTPVEEPIWSLECHTHTVSSVAFSPDGQWALTGSHDDTARLWDAATGEVLRTFRGHEDSEEALLPPHYLRMAPA